MLKATEIDALLNEIVEAIRQRADQPELASLITENCKKLQGCDYSLGKAKLLDVIRDTDPHVSIFGCETFFSVYAGSEDTHIAIDAIRRHLLNDDVMVISQALILVMKLVDQPDDFEGEIQQLLDKFEGNIQLLIAAVGVQFPNLQDRCRPLLVDALRSDVSDFRLIAALALIRVHIIVEWSWKIAENYLVRDHETTAMCISILQGMFPRAPETTVKYLITWFENLKSEESKLFIIRIIGRSGEGSDIARAFLLDQVVGANSAIVLLAYEALMQIANDYDRATDILIDRLSCHDSQLREVCAKALLLNSKPLSVVQTARITRRFDEERDLDILELLFRVLKKNGHEFAIAELVRDVEEPFDFRAWIKVFLATIMSEDHPAYMIRLLAQNPNKAKSNIIAMCLQANRFVASDTIGDLESILQSGDLDSTRNILIALQNVGANGVRLAPALFKIVESDNSLAELAYSVLTSIGFQALQHLPKRTKSHHVELLRVHLETISLTGSPSLLQEFRRDSLRRFLSLADEFLANKARSLNAARTKILHRLKDEEAKQGFSDGAVRDLIDDLESVLSKQWNRTVQLFTKTEEKSTKPRILTVDGKRFAHLVQLHGRLSKI